LKVTFLGTGTSTGVPIILCTCSVCKSTNAKDARLRSSIMVEVDGNNFVIDSGPDFRQQMIRADVKDITAIIYTHEHIDHIIGLDDVRPFNFFLKKDMQLYATERVQDNIKRAFDYIFKENKYPGIPQIQLNTITNKPFSINGTDITPIKVMHYKMPVLGFRFGKFTYITDANFISPEEKEKIMGTEVLVLNALREEAHISHFTLQEAIDLVEEIKPKKAYFTHISHQLGLHEEVQKKLPENISLAYDGLEINV